MNRRTIDKLVRHNIVLGISEQTHVKSVLTRGTAKSEQKHQFFEVVHVKENMNQMKRFQEYS